MEILKLEMKQCEHIFIIITPNVLFGSTILVFTELVGGDPLIIWSNKYCLELSRSLCTEKIIVECLNRYCYPNSRNARHCRIVK